MDIRDVVREAIAEYLSMKFDLRNFLSYSDVDCMTKSYLEDNRGYVEDVIVDRFSSSIDEIIVNMVHDEIEDVVDSWIDSCVDEI